MKPVSFIFISLSLLFMLQTAESADYDTLAVAPAQSAPVPPFSAAETQQIFSKTVHGGIQHAIVKSADNVRQIKIIQARLTYLTAQYRQGDFAESERVYGADMPGLKRLRQAKPYDIKFVYEALDNGAQIHYSTEYPEYVIALHEWLDAQNTTPDKQQNSPHALHHLSPAE